MTNETAAQAEPGAELSGIEKDRQLLLGAKKKGLLPKLGVYTRLSGPGWLQSAITLGGGSLSSSLYLGVLGGFALLWLQPVAMIIGIIMLSAIGYVTLSTGENPFRAINKHVNPVLGWGWLIATLMANCVWSLPQFSLACGAFRQNLFPNLLAGVAANVANGWIAGSIAVLCIVIVFFYNSGGKGVKFFHILLKVMVGIIVLSFFGVVVHMTVMGVLDWGKIGAGLIPDLRMLWTPAATFNNALAAAGNFKDFWTARIVAEQQDVLVAAAATAVGINMTFLLPYSMLKRGWNKDFRGLAVFDLSTALFIPFILATGCVVIASASQFHTAPAIPFPADDAAVAITEVDPVGLDAGKIQSCITKAYEHCLTDKAKDSFPTDAVAAVSAVMGKEGFADLELSAKQAAVKAALVAASEGKLKPMDKKLFGGYKKVATARVKAQRKDAFAKLSKAQVDQAIEDLPLADRKIAAMLVRRDSIHLARALSPLTGDKVAHYVFGVGVIGMAVSSIIILMLINGFCICEMFNKPSTGWLYRAGCLMPAVGLLGPFIWSGAAPYLAIPTSVVGFIVIPIAYTTFALLLNQKKLLGDNMPKGIGRWIWNFFMLVGVLAVTIGSVYMAHKKAGWYGIAGIAAFIGAATVVHFIRKKRGKESLP